MCCPVWIWCWCEEVNGEVRCCDCCCCCCKRHGELNCCDCYYDCLDFCSGCYAFCKSSCGVMYQALCCNCSVCVHENGECYNCCLKDENQADSCLKQCAWICDETHLNIKPAICLCPQEVDEGRGCQYQFGCQDCVCCCLPCPDCETPIWDTSKSTLYCDVTCNKLYIDRAFCKPCLCEDDDDDADDESQAESQDENKRFWCWTFGKGFLEALLVNCLWCRWSRKTRQYEFDCGVISFLWDPKCYGRQNCCLGAICQLIHTSAGCVKDFWWSIIFLIASFIAFFHGLLLSLVHCLYCLFVSCGLCVACKCDHDMFCQDCACLCLVCKNLKTPQLVMEWRTNVAEANIRHCSCCCLHCRCVCEQYNWCKEKQNSKSPTKLPLPDAPIVSQPSSIHMNPHKNTSKEIVCPYSGSSTCISESGSSFESEPEHLYANVKLSTQNESDHNLIEVLKDKRKNDATDDLFYRSGGAVKSSSGGNPTHGWLQKSSFIESAQDKSQSKPSNDVVLQELDMSLSETEDDQSPIYVNEPSKDLVSNDSIIYVNESPQRGNEPVYDNETSERKDNRKKLRKSDLKHNLDQLDRDYENIELPNQKKTKRHELPSLNRERFSRSQEVRGLLHLESCTETSSDDYGLRKHPHRYANVPRGASTFPDRFHKAGKKMVRFGEPLVVSGGWTLDEVNPIHVQRRQDLVDTQPHPTGSVRPKEKHNGRKLQMSEEEGKTSGRNAFGNSDYYNYMPSREQLIDTPSALDDEFEDDVHAVPYSGTKPRTTRHNRDRTFKEDFLKETTDEDKPCSIPYSGKKHRVHWQDGENLIADKLQETEQSDDDDIYSVPYSGKTLRVDWDERQRAKRKEKERQRKDKVKICKGLIINNEQTDESDSYLVPQSDERSRKSRPSKQKAHKIKEKTRQIDEFQNTMSLQKVDLRLDVSKLVDNDVRNNDYYNAKTEVRSSESVSDDTLPIKKSISQRMKKLRAKKSLTLDDSRIDSVTGSELELEDLNDSKPLYVHVQETQRKGKGDTKKKVKGSKKTRKKDSERKHIGHADNERDASGPNGKCMVDTRTVYGCLVKEYQNVSTDEAASEGQHELDDEFEAGVDVQLKETGRSIKRSRKGKKKSVDGGKRKGKITDLTDGEIFMETNF